MCLSVKIFGAKCEISVKIFYPLSGGQTLRCSTSIRDEKNKLIYFPLPLRYHLHNTYNKSLLKATDISSGSLCGNFYKMQKIYYRLCLCLGLGR